MKNGRYLYVVYPAYFFNYRLFCFEKYVMMNQQMLSLSEGTEKEEGHKKQKGRNGCE